MGWVDTTRYYSDEGILSDRHVLSRLHPSHAAQSVPEPTSSNPSQERLHHIRAERLGDAISTACGPERCDAPLPTLPFNASVLGLEFLSEGIVTRETIDPLWNLSAEGPFASDAQPLALKSMAACERLGGSFACWGLSALSSPVAGGLIGTFGDHPGEVQALRPVDISDGLGCAAGSKTATSVCADASPTSNLFEMMGYSARSPASPQADPLASELLYVGPQAESVEVYECGTTGRRVPFCENAVGGFWNASDVDPGCLTADVSNGGGNGTGGPGGNATENATTSGAGNGTVEIMPPPRRALLPLVSPAAASLVREISGLENDVCAIVETPYEVASRGVKCYGGGNSGAHGIGYHLPYGRTPEEMQELGCIDFLSGLTMHDPTVSPVHVSAGYSTACAVFSNGGLACWGVGRYGARASGNQNYIGSIAGSMAGLEFAKIGVFARPGATSPVAGRRALSVSVGDSFGCGLFQGGRIACWGRNHAGQRGTGDSASGCHTAKSCDALEAVKFNPEKIASPAVAIAAGKTHTCAIFANGRATCWGYSNAYQLGLGTKAKVPAITSIGYIPFAETVPAVTDIAPAETHTCAVFADGAVRCWGKPGNGATGSDVTLGGTVESMRNLPPIEFKPPHTFAVRIAASTYNSCAVFVSGAILCWGVNMSGSLGQGFSNKDVYGQGTNKVSDLDPVPLFHPTVDAVIPDSVPSGGGTVTLRGNSFFRGASIKVSLSLVGSAPGTPDAERAACRALLWRNETVFTEVNVTVPCGDGGGGGAVGEGGRNSSEPNGTATTSGTLPDPEPCFSLARVASAVEVQNENLRSAVAELRSVSEIVIEVPPSPCAPGAQIDVSLMFDRNTVVPREAPVVQITHYFDGTSRITAVHPLSGPTSGNTVVTLYGVDIIETRRMRCLFGDLAPVEAQFVPAVAAVNGSDTGIPVGVTCVTPASPSNGVHRATYAADPDVPASPSSVSFMFYAATASKPNVGGGPVEGGTEVTVPLAGVTDHFSAFAARDAPVAVFTVLVPALPDEGTDAYTITIEVAGSFVDPATVAPWGKVAWPPANETVAVQFVAPPVASRVPFPERVLPLTFDVAVSPNGGQQFLDPVPFEVFQLPATISVHPASVPLDYTSDIAIVLYGVNYLSREGSAIEIRYGDRGGEGGGEGGEPPASLLVPAMVDPLLSVATTTLRHPRRPQNYAGGSPYPVDPWTAATWTPEDWSVATPRVLEVGQLTPGVGSVAFTNYGPRRSAETAEITFFRLLSVAPRGTPIHMSPTLTVSGTGFGFTGRWECVFSVAPAPDTSGSGSGIGVGHAVTVVSKTTAQVVDRDTIVCSAPTEGHSSVAGKAWVAVSSDDRHLSNQLDQDVTLYNQPVITSVRPLGVTAGAAVRLTLAGDGIIDLGDGAAACRIAGEVFPAEYVAPVWTDPFPRPFAVCSVSAARDDAPRVAGTVAVEYAPNGVSFTPQLPPAGEPAWVTEEAVARRSFVRYAGASVDPSGGPFHGGTLVVIAGGGFDARLAPWRCVFGPANASVPAMAVSPTQVQCTAPDVDLAAPGVDLPTTVEVRVASERNLAGGADAVAADLGAGMHFSYFLPPVVTSMEPSSGPAAGGTVVVVGGERLSPVLAGQDVLASLGGGTASPATVSPDGTSLTFTTVEGSGAFPLHISLNGRDYAVAEDFVFRFFTVLGAEPVLVPVLGGTMVTVSGSGFRDNTRQETRCRFTVPSEVAAAAGITGDDGLFVDTKAVRILDEGRFLCESPPLAAFLPSVSQDTAGNSSAAAGAGEDETERLFGWVIHPVLSVTTNGEEFSVGAHPIVFSAYEVPEITSISPRGGPRGGDASASDPTYLVTLYGMRFPSTEMVDNEAAFCRFGGAAGKAYVVSPTTAYCVVPSTLGTGPASVSLTFNGREGPADVMQSPMNFWRFEIAGIGPSSGPVTGGTTVTMSGNGFSQTVSYLCVTTGGEVLSEATFVESTELLCKVPSPGSSAVASSSRAGGLVGRSGGVSAGAVGRRDPPPQPYHRAGPSRVMQVSQAAGGGNASALPEPADPGPDGGTGSPRTLPITVSVVAGTYDANAGDVSSPDGTNATSASPGTGASECGNGTCVGVPVGGPVFTYAVPFSLDLYDPPVVSAIQPTSVPSSGGAITVFGAYLSSPANVMCRVSGSTASGDTVEAVVTAQVVSASEAVCVFPGRPKSDGLLVAVSGNAQQFEVAPSEEVAFSFTACSPGTYAFFDTDPCVPCEPGTFAPNEAARECEACSTTSYADQPGLAACLPCPDGTSVRSGVADAIEKCTCNAGFFSPDGIAGVTCLACPTGAACAGMLEPLESEEGWWAPADDRTSLVQCANPAACPAGPTERCKEGYQGRMCAECAPAFYKADASTCNQCPEGSSLTLIAFVLFCFLITALLIKYVGRRARAYAGMIGIATKFYQVLAIIMTLGVRWPDLVRNTAKVITVPFTLDINVLATECSMPAISFEAKWTLTLLLPLFFLVLFGLVFLVMKVHAIRAGRAKSTTPMSKAINGYLFLLSLSYLLLASTTLELFACQGQADGSIALVADPSLICFEGWWFRLIPGAIVSAIVYVIGIPVALAFFLHRNREYVTDPGFNLRYGSLFAVYTARHPYWEAAVMAEKFLIAFVAMLWNGFVSLQLAALSLLFTISLVLYRTAEPYNSASDNQLHEVLRWCVVVTLAAAHTFHSDDFPNSFTRDLATTAALACMIVGTAVILAYIVRDSRRLHLLHKVSIDPTLLRDMEVVLTPQMRVTAERWLRDIGRVDRTACDRWQVLLTVAMGELIDHADMTQAAEEKAETGRAGGPPRLTRMGSKQRFTLDDMPASQRTPSAPVVLREGDAEILLRTYTGDGFQRQLLPYLVDFLVADAPGASEMLEWFSAVSAARILGEGSKHGQKKARAAATAARVASRNIARRGSGATSPAERAIVEADDEAVDPRTRKAYDALYGHLIPFDVISPCAHTLLDDKRWTKAMHTLAVVTWTLAGDAIISRIQSRPSRREASGSQSEDDVPRAPRAHRSLGVISEAEGLVDNGEAATQGEGASETGRIERGTGRTGPPAVREQQSGRASGRVAGRRDSADHILPPLFPRERKSRERLPPIPGGVWQWSGGTETSKEDAAPRDLDHDDATGMDFFEVDGKKLYVL